MCTYDIHTNTAYCTQCVLGDGVEELFSPLWFISRVLVCGVGNIYQLIAAKFTHNMTIWHNRRADLWEFLQAEQYDVKKMVVKEIWGRKSRISTTRPHWTDHELKEDVLSRKFRQALSDIVKSTPTHQKSVHLNLWYAGCENFLKYDCISPHVIYIFWHCTYQGTKISWAWGKDGRRASIGVVNRWASDGRRSNRK